MDESFEHATLLHGALEPESENEARLHDNEQNSSAPL